MSSPIGSCVSTRADPPVALDPGATLKTITDATGCKIDIPRRDTLSSAPSGPRTNGNADDSDSEDEAEDPSVTISLTGPTPSLADAKKRILALIHTKVSQTSISIKDIPSSFYPFIAGPRGSKARQLEKDIGAEQVQIHVPPPAIWKSLEKQGEQEGEAEDQVGGKGKRDIAIKIKGDMEYVNKVVAEIRRQYEDLVGGVSWLSLVTSVDRHRCTARQRPHFEHLHSQAPTPLPRRCCCRRDP